MSRNHHGNKISCFSFTSTKFHVGKHLSHSQTRVGSGNVTRKVLPSPPHQSFVPPLIPSAYDQAVALNEVGRMFLHFGDRKSACRFFRKSAAVATKVQGVYNPTSDLVRCVSSLFGLTSLTHGYLSLDVIQGYSLCLCA